LAGSGSGLLALMAAKLGAEKVVAIEVPEQLQVVYDAYIIPGMILI